MNSAEFQQYFGHFYPEEALEAADRWFALPMYFHLPEADNQRNKALVELQESVEVFVEHHRQEIASLVKGDKHFEALEKQNLE